jgi:hypothetical protein
VRVVCSAAAARYVRLRLLALSVPQQEDTNICLGVRCLPVRLNLLVLLEVLVAHSHLPDCESNAGRCGNPASFAASPSILPTSRAIPPKQALIFFHLSHRKLSSANFKSRLSCLKHGVNRLLSVPESQSTSDGEDTNPRDGSSLFSSALLLAPLFFFKKKYMNPQVHCSALLSCLKQLDRLVSSRPQRFEDSVL